MGIIEGLLGISVVLVNVLTAASLLDKIREDAEGIDVHLTMLEQRLELIEARLNSLSSFPHCLVPPSPPETPD